MSTDETPLRRQTFPELVRFVSGGQTVLWTCLRGAWRLHGRSRPTMVGAWRSVLRPRRSQRSCAGSRSATWRLGTAVDTDAMAQLITDDVVWVDPALPEPARGIPAVQEFMRVSLRAFPDLRFGEPDPPALAVTGDVVLWAWYMEGTHRGPHRSARFRAHGPHVCGWTAFDQWTMRDGRIARYRAFYDMNDVARQLGIVPAPGSRAERGMVALQRLQARLSRR